MGKRKAANSDAGGTATATPVVTSAEQRQFEITMLALTYLKSNLDDAIEAVYENGQVSLSNQKFRPPTEAEVDNAIKTAVRNMK
jgi:hypothetical protein